MGARAIVQLVAWPRYRRGRAAWRRDVELHDVELHMVSLLDLEQEWAWARPYDDNAQRTDALEEFLHPTTGRIEP